jgi:arginyl-tRNA synthetase
MSLKGLIKLVHDEIEPKIKEDITGEERADIANKLTLATLKYSDLTPQRRTDYIFDVEKFTEFVGKTGIYAVYTTTRIKSLLNKVNVENTSLTNIPNQEVRDILVKLTELPKSLTASYQDASLNYICDFIYELSSLFNKFYGDHNISNETNEEDKNTYIALSKLVYNTLSNLLNILAIDEVNKM